MGVDREGDDPTYPGTVTASPIGEVAQRSFYRRWLEFMTADAWPMLP